MAKGIIYITTTSVTGLIKIGKTGSDQFEYRMAQLEQNGYWNTSGHHRFFAVEVDDYDEKEKLIHKMFNKSQVATSELFALDKNLAKELLVSFGGKQVYPKEEKASEGQKHPISQEKTASSTNISNTDKSVVPDGVYYFRRKVKAWGNKEVLATMRVQNGKYYVLKGSTICPVLGKTHNSMTKSLRDDAKIQDDILAEDYEVNAPSTAGLLVLGGACNGWTDWKTKDGRPIDIYRKADGK